MKSLIPIVKKYGNKATSWFNIIKNYNKFINIKPNKYFK
jgi:hypothetical protein